MNSNETQIIEGSEKVALNENKSSSSQIEIIKNETQSIVDLKNVR